MTITMRALLAARNGADHIPITGLRQAKAARALVAQGMAARFESQSRLSGGETYYNYFRRAYATRVSRADIGGILYFNA